MKREFNKYIKSLDEQELAKELKKLYDKFELVRKYYEMELGQNTDKVLEEYKKKIRKEYFPTRGYGQARSSVSRKVVAEFRKVSVHDADIAEILMYRVEVMMEFTMAYGDIDEAFYNSLCSGFNQACKMIVKQALQEQYRKRALALVHTSDNFGWGVYDYLLSEYNHFFGEEG